MSRRVGFAALCVAFLWAPGPARASGEPAAANAPPPLRYRLHAGIQSGLPFAYGLTAVNTLYAAGRPRFDLDFLWEPSAGMQSYSVGFAWHIVDSMFYVGPRVRLLQLHAPWVRGYDAGVDNHLGLGLEVGLRAPVGPDGRLLITVALSATAVPTQTQATTLLAGLHLGIAWGVYGVREGKGASW